MGRRQYAHHRRCTVNRFVKRFWIVLLAVAMTIVVALPAAAKGKPDKPDRRGPTLFEVTFEFLGDGAGFSTTTGCTTAGVITMEAGPGGRLGSINEGLGTLDADLPMIDVRLPGLEWYRYYPYYADVEEVPGEFDPNDYPLSAPLTGADLTGCHGAGIDVFVDQDDAGTKSVINIEQYPGILMLTLGNGTVDLLWHSDYYREWLVTEPKNPRQSPNVSVTDMEDFSYVDNQLDWTGVWDQTKASTGVVTGEINITHFSPGAYVPFPGSPVSVKFTMTITPKT